MAYDYHYNFEIRRADYSRRGQVLGQTVVKQLNDFSLDHAYALLCWYRHGRMQCNDFQAMWRCA